MKNYIQYYIWIIQNHSEKTTSHLGLTHQKIKAKFLPKTTCFWQESTIYLLNVNKQTTFSFLDLFIKSSNRYFSVIPIDFLKGWSNASSIHHNTLLKKWKNQNLNKCNWMQEKEFNRFMELRNLSAGDSLVQILRILLKIASDTWSPSLLSNTYIHGGYFVCVGKSI